MVPKKKKERPVIGWREWVGLPELGIAAIKVKVDTGARSSSLHAVQLKFFKRGGCQWVRFTVHPVQRTRKAAVTAEAAVLEFRSVKSSSGVAGMRPVIVTPIKLMGKVWPVELTLAGRDEMGFRMLLGREAFRGRFLVDAGRSYYGGRIKKNVQERMLLDDDREI
jgi:hypothetical protein